MRNPHCPEAQSKRSNVKQRFSGDIKRNTAKKKKRERERKTQKRKQLGKQTKQAQHRTHGPNKVFCNLKAAQSKAEHLEKFLRF